MSLDTINSVIESLATPGASLSCGPALPSW
jgi:hypothetical protein